MRDLIFIPRRRTVHRLPDLKIGDKVRVTTTYTYSANYSRVGTIVGKTEAGSAVVEYKRVSGGGFNFTTIDYLYHSEYYRVRVIA